MSGEGGCERTADDATGCVRTADDATGCERRCPECGAVLGEYSTCEELFHRALAMEWEAPGAYEAHHLLVATYMLQHPSRLTDEGRELYETMVPAVVDEGLSAPELRERNRGRYDQDKRDWKLTRKVSAEPVLREWPQTIANVIDGPAEELPARVWHWARAVR